MNCYHVAYRLGELPERHIVIVMAEAPNEAMSFAEAAERNTGERREVHILSVTNAEDYDDEESREPHD